MLGVSLRTFHLKLNVCVWRGGGVIAGNKMSQVKQKSANLHLKPLYMEQPWTWKHIIFKSQIRVHSVSPFHVDASTNSTLIAVYCFICLYQYLISQGHLVGVVTDPLTVCSWNCHIYQHTGLISLRGSDLLIPWLQPTEVPSTKWLPHAAYVNQARCPVYSVI